MKGIVVHHSLEGEGDMSFTIEDSVVSVSLIEWDGQCV